jgi:hypothetical protein
MRFWKSNNSKFLGAIKPKGLNKIVGVIKKNVGIEFSEHGLFMESLLCPSSRKDWKAKLFKAFRGQENQSFKRG